MAFSLPLLLSLVSSLVLVRFLSPVAAYKPLSDSFLRSIPSPGSDIDPRSGSLLAPILIPRIPGTLEHASVQHHFVNFFQTELPKWSLEWQNSTSHTPISNAELPFANLVFKREPPWAKPGETSFLTLVAHYDSKYRPEGFIGAVDSAAPCAMLLHVAKVIDGHMQRMYDKKQELGKGNIAEMNMGVQILLLDGEEAFVRWTDDDSLYGSRALAQQWSLSHNPPAAHFHKYRTPLSQISLFVLLDLLGSASPKVLSYFFTTHWAYKHLASVESRMRSLGLLESSPMSPFLPGAQNPTMFSSISDDHLPFMGMGVEILHIIPSPFPDVWHKMSDTGDNLDMPTVRDWSKLVAAFTLEWLDVEGSE